MQPDDPSSTPLGESDLTELAAKFASPTGAGLAPDLALDLALQMVLHEIVEEACAVTTSTGAAIALSQDGELVCRASHGSTAPPLGSRLESRAGLSGECLRTLQVQLCNDTLTDLRVDFDACSRLGVHSLVVIPLLRAGEMVGLFEVLSSRSSAFGQSDVSTLQALAARVLKNLDLAAGASVPVAKPETAPSAAEVAADPPLVLAERAGGGRRWTDIATWALACVVVAYAGWLGMRVVEHFTSQKQAVNRPFVGVKSFTTLGGSVNAPVGSAAGPSSGVSATSVPAAPVVRDRSRESRSAERTRWRTPEGGLRVYENGREVFRMPASDAEPLAEPGVVQAASLQPENVLQLSAGAAESDLIHRVEPDYPEQARLEGIQGSVVLEVHIGSEGAVEEVKVVSGQPVLADAAMAAVKQWRFRPRQVNGQPARMQTTVTLKFRLPS